MSERSLLARDHGIRIDREEDALDVIAFPGPGLIFDREDLAPSFFDLRSGLAGAVFQKLVNYHRRTVFVIPDDHDLGARVTELAREHANHPIVRVVGSVTDAARWLGGSD